MVMAPSQPVAWVGHCIHPEPAICPAHRKGNGLRFPYWDKAPEGNVSEPADAGDGPGNSSLFFCTREWWGQLLPLLFLFSQHIHRKATFKNSKLVYAWVLLAAAACVRVAAVVLCQAWLCNLHTCKTATSALASRDIRCLCICVEQDATDVHL